MGNNGFPSAKDALAATSGTLTQDLPRANTLGRSFVSMPSAFYYVAPFKPIVPSGGRSFRALPYRYTTYPAPFSMEGMAGLSVQLVQMVMVEGTKEPYILKGLSGWKHTLAKYSNPS